MQGITTHVSALKRNTNWTTDLNKNTDTHSLVPSLLRILVVIRKIAHTFVRFWNTAGQSSSAADSILPMYLEDINISRVHP